MDLYSNLIFYPFSKHIYIRSSLAFPISLRSNLLDLIRRKPSPDRQRTLIRQTLHTTIYTFPISILDLQEQVFDRAVAWPITISEVNVENFSRTGRLKHRERDMQYDGDEGVTTSVDNESVFSVYDVARWSL